MNILFFGSAPTIGDGGIGAAILDELRDAWPDAEIRVHTGTPEAYAGYPVCRGMRIGPKPEIGLRSSRSLLPWGLDFQFRYLWHLFDVRYFGGRLGRGGLADTIRESFGWADLVIYQGGPGWNDLFLSPGILRARLLRFAAARHHGAASVLYAQSFGPYRWEGVRGRLIRRFAGGVLNRVDLITVRDDFSLEHLRRIGVRRPRLVQASDAAVRLRAAPADRGRAILAEFGIERRERPLIGLSIRAIRGRYGFPEGTQARFEVEMAACLDRVLAELGDVVFLSTDYDEHPGRENDLEAFRNVQKLMKRSDEIRVIDRPYLPQEIAAIYGQLELFVGVRLHPIIFAMGRGIPCLSIGYAPKCRDLMEQMGLANWSLDYDRFDATEGFEKLSELCRDREAVSRRVVEGMAVLRERAGRSLEALKILMAERMPPPAPTSARESLATREAVAEGRPR